MLYTLKDSLLLVPLAMIIMMGVSYLLDRESKNYVIHGIAAGVLVYGIMMLNDTPLNSNSFEEMLPGPPDF